MLLKNWIRNGVFGRLLKVAWAAPLVPATTAVITGVF